MICFALAATTAFSLSPLTAVPHGAYLRANIALSIKGYTRIGDVPAGVDFGPADLAAVGAMIDERDACRTAKEFERADELKEQLKVLGGDAWGIKVRDAERTWYVSRRNANSRGRSSLVVRKAPKGASVSLYEEGKRVVRQREERQAILLKTLRAQTKTTEKPIKESPPVEAPGGVEPAPASAVDLSPAVAAPPAGFDWGATF